jgi:prephenate dehydratase
MEKMGFLGPPGTHSEAAALYLNGVLPEPAELTAYPEIFAALQAVADHKADSCLVPVENSLEGSINITLDTLARSDELIVRRELIWRVHNQLMAKCPVDAVRLIYSHAQPLAQCRGYLKAHFPQARLIAAASTARAAALVAASDPAEGCAAICTARAGELYGLTAVATEIQDSSENCTRFYQVGRRPALPLPQGDTGRALIICQIDGSRAGSLCEVLQEFASRHVNMTRIESRPARTELGAYLFFFDLEINGGPRCKLTESIAAVQRRSIWLRHLGEFPVLIAKQK